MVKIWKILKAHLRADFDVRLYATIAVFLIVAITINYSINLENGIIDKFTGKSIRILWYFLLYAFVYLTSSWIVFSFKGTRHYFRSPLYWTLVFVGLIVLSTNVGFPFLAKLATTLTTDKPYLFRWMYGVVNNAGNLFITTIPLLLFAWWFDRRTKDTRENFGVHRRDVDLVPYWQLLAVVLPLVIAASFETGFKNYYPTYRRYQIDFASHEGSWPGYVYALIFEFFYGMDFFNVEFMFRGLFVVGISRVIGPQAILPMVSMYCVLHFGKPIGECISSAFGGYILGVVALHTRNVWGGVMVHMGLAWMMELVAYVSVSR